MADAETQTSVAERQCLARHATGKKRLVEIGVWHGVTTRVLRKVMAPDAILFAIDPYPIGRLGFSAPRIIAHKEITKVSNGAVQWVRSTGIVAAKKFASQPDGLFDFLFIDGDHSYDGLRGDWESWSPLVAPNGIIALHDSCSSATRSIDDAGSAIYTREVILKDSHFERVEAVDTLTVMIRR